VLLAAALGVEVRDLFPSGEDAAGNDGQLTTPSPLRTSGGQAETI
jgi:hypothetical protein